MWVYISGCVPVSACDVSIRGGRGGVCERPCVSMFSCIIRGWGVSSLCGRQCRHLCACARHCVVLGVCWLICAGIFSVHQYCVYLYRHPRGVNVWYVSV